MELSATKKALLALRQMQSKLDALEQAKREPIAIVGMGCRFPGANSPEEFWQLLQDGKDAVTSIPIDRSDELNNQDGIVRGGFIPYLKEFDPSFFRIAPREAASIDPQQRLLLEVSWSALENAAIAADKVRGSKTGVFIGIAAVDYWHQLLSRKETEIDAYLTTGNTHSLASGRISHFFDFTGTSMSLDTACSSSLVAVHLAIKSLRDRECNMALAGGVNRLVSSKVSLNFLRAKMLSPDGRCKTFDESANGFVRSEGCGIVVLKRLSDAIAERDNIKAVLLGSATNQDGRTSSITTPSSLSQQVVIKEALANSKVRASQVSYLETHGTGTSLGDAIELEALSRVFKDNRELVLGAVKTNIGHLESAAGIASLIKTVLALEHRSIPGNLNLVEPNHQVEWQALPFKLPNRTLSWDTQQPRIAGVSSFGFSGTNAHLIVRENDLAIAEDKIERKAAYLFTVSAKGKKALDELVAKYIDYLDSHPNSKIEDVCFTANIGRSHLLHRLAASVSSITDLRTKLTQYISGKTPLKLWQGKANSQNNKPALVIEPANLELQRLIESLLDNSVAVDLADICWRIGNSSPSSFNEQKVVYSPAKPEINNWQIAIAGLAQLYTLGVEINWDVLGEKSGGQKISLPTYPWQRSVYWLE